MTIITLNEESNIERAIQSVKWAEDIVVIDSGSTDRTVELAKRQGARVIHNPWPGYGQQKNFAQNQARHDWVLNLDADEEVPAALRTEIERTLSENEAGGRPVRGYFLPRKTFYLGRWIQHGGWYPNYIQRLGDRRSARWTEPSVHEELKVSEGESRHLQEPLHHYTFASIQDQILTNLRFSRLGSQELQRRGRQGSLFWLILKPIGKFFETYVIKRGFMDGLPGFIISVNAAHSMFLKYAYLIEADMRLGSRHPETCRRTE